MALDEAMKSEYKSGGMDVHDRELGKMLLLRYPWTERQKYLAQGILDNLPSLQRQIAHIKGRCPIRG